LAHPVRQVIHLCQQIRGDRQRDLFLPAPDNPLAARAC
jgi:hypothetical protein